jgi:uncharacterized protein YgiM (DUF1202 family)
MKYKWYLWIFASLLIVSLASCSQITGQPTTDSAAVGTIVAQNVQLTQAASTLNSVLSTSSVTPIPPTQTVVMPSDTPTLQFTLTPTPIKGFWLTFSQNTNCRTGPGGYYPRVILINAGEKVEAVARTDDSNYYYMRYVDTTTHYCWVSAQYAYKSGDSDRLPMYTVQPTSTPTITPTADAGFTFSYSSLAACSSNYALQLTVKNTGYLPWQSYKLSITDSTKSSTVTVTSDSFITYDSCVASESQDDLSTGESAVISNYDSMLSYNPTGDTLTIVISLYSNDGLSGTVMTKEITVKP